MTKRPKKVTESEPLGYASIAAQPGGEGSAGLADSTAPYVVSRGTTIYLYRAPLARFLSDVAAGRLVPMLEERFKELEGHAASPSEVDSWRGSLPRLAHVLSDSRLVTAHIVVELKMPLGGRRCDALLSGHDLDDQPAAVVVELKAWPSAKKSAIPEDVAIGKDSRQHPSAQVRDYVQFMRHHHSAFVLDGVRLAGCAYLHDMKDPQAVKLLRDTALFGTLATDYPMYVAGEESKLADWLRGHVGGGHGNEVAETIARGHPCTSEKLLDVLSEAVQGRHEWKLLDEQRRAFMIIRTAVETARADGRKCVVLVRGGPGTGKSVLAIQLLGHGANKHWRVVHATGSQAFQTNLQAKTEDFALEKLKAIYGAKTKAALPVKELFCTFAHVAALREPDVFDLVVADEAHRLWHHRMLPRGAGVWKQVSDTPMVEEMIRASRVTAFFLDDNQSVRAEEIGQSQVIRDHAKRMGVQLIEVDLTLQFRCNGSASYVNWVDGLVGFRDDLDLGWRRYDGYHLHVDDSVQKTADRLAMHRLAGQKCRMVAGFCWKWSEPVGTTLARDVTDPAFNGWSAPWIEKTAQNLPPMSHRYYLWANSDAHAEQVGSIYSVQGFEFDHVGVIWGEDLVWRKGEWRYVKEKNQDTRFKRDLQRSGEDPARKLRNIYRVLLTRGMQGTALFVVDEETRAHVRECLEEHRVRQVG